MKVERFLRYETTTLHSKCPSCGDVAVRAGAEGEAGLRAVLAAWDTEADNGRGAAIPGSLTRITLAELRARITPLPQGILRLRTVEVTSKRPCAKCTHAALGLVKPFDVLLPNAHPFVPPLAAPGEAVGGNCVPPPATAHPGKPKGKTSKKAKPKPPATTLLADIDRLFASNERPKPLQEPRSFTIRAGEEPQPGSYRPDF